MSEAQLIKTDSMSHERNAKRVARDEAELKELLQQAGVIDDTEEEEPQQQEEVAVEAEPVEERKAEVKPTEESDDTELSAEEKNFKKRYGDLRRHVQDKEQEWKVKFEQLEAQLNAAAKNELVLPKSEQDIEAWAKKYPDVAGIVEAIADKKANERAADLDGRLKEIEELRTTALNVRRLKLSLLHCIPTLVTSVKTMPSIVGQKNNLSGYKDALYENSEDAKSVARVIDLYKSDKGITNKKASSSDKGAAASVTTKRTTSPNHEESSNYLRESQVAKMSMKEYEKRAEDIFEAQRQGKFIYDMSKK